MIKYTKATFLAFTVLSTAVLASGCKKKDSEKLDLSSSHTEAQTMAAETSTAVEITTEAESTQAPTTAVDSAHVTGMTAQTEQYTSNKVSVQYPTFFSMDDKAKEESINELIRTNALSVVSGLGINEATDSLNVTCNVVSADRNRITITYQGEYQKQGAANPTKLFYSNTISVSSVKDLGFSHFVDPYTMAGYVLSNDCKFAHADAATISSLMEEKNTKTIQEYTNLFNNADFPFEGTFPTVFSYEVEGDIYFTIPVSHELGDYAIVIYTPDTK